MEQITVEIEASVARAVRAAAADMGESALESLERAEELAREDSNAAEAVGRRRAAVAALDDLQAQLEPGADAAQDRVCLEAPRALLAEALYVALSAAADDVAAGCQDYWRHEVTLASLRDRTDRFVDLLTELEHVGGLTGAH